MPRPRIFNEDAALAAATAEFWHRGYAGTSVRDLGASMGLGPASFYNAFGDKRSLFLRCMDRYLDDGVRARIKRLEQERSPRDAIEEFIIEILALSRRDRRGCLMVNAVLEFGTLDDEIGVILRERLGELESFFRRCLRAAQREGAIAPQMNVADVARLMLAAIMGLRVLARTRPEPALLDGAAREALALLGPRPARA
ncbi:MAG: TetR/AcrR family transcriptional regulator [Alphaproteobacteria bacterium]|jgi:TetR/AcrR family transcriptional repressor of nem operon|nr:TetR/AcrR family transcriptional regulator [Roseomonas sp.]MCA3417265.1 TetR/AcrR family transcriptional regulator [Roseomonas sp.]